MKYVKKVLSISKDMEKYASIFLKSDDDDVLQYKQKLMERKWYEVHSDRHLLSGHAMKQIVATTLLYIDEYEAAKLIQTLSNARFKVFEVEAIWDVYQYGEFSELKGESVAAAETLQEDLEELNEWVQKNISVFVKTD